MHPAQAGLGWHTPVPQKWVADPSRMSPWWREYPPHPRYHPGYHVVRPKRIPPYSRCCVVVADIVDIGWRGGAVKATEALAVPSGHVHRMPDSRFPSNMGRM